jgi:charged multivesicular body protein 6
MGHFFSKLFGSEDRHHHQQQQQTSTITKQENQQKIASNHDQAVLDIKLARDKVSKYQKQLGTLMNKELEIAKRLLAEGKKDRAKLALQKRKYQEQLLKKTDQQLQNLSHLVQEIEFAQIEVQVVNGLKEGKDALVNIQKEMGSIDDIEKLMEETREAIEYQQEISRVLSENLTAQDVEDVDEEYAEMERELLAADLGSISVPTDQIPIATTTTTQQTVEEEADEEEEDRQPIAV